jgi:RHS repeat-associated protein
MTWRPSRSTRCWGRDGQDGDLDGGSEEGDNTLYYTTDANFNVTALVDAETGEVVERYMYDPYGKATVCEEDWTPREDNASAVANDFLYCGYRFDAETGLYNVRHRYYHPTLGRWTQRDSGYLDALNLYEYARGMPSGAVDPRGLFMKVTHSVLTQRALSDLGVPSDLAACIIRANVSSDDVMTFLGNIEGHALSSTWWGMETSWADRERREAAMKKWRQTTEDLKAGAIAKLKKNCCDCSAARDIGRLTHYIQDAAFHDFNSWLGWHYNPIPPLVVGGSLGGLLGAIGAVILTKQTGVLDAPINQEMQLDDYFGLRQEEGLEDVINNPGRQQGPYAAVVKAFGETQRVLGDIVSSIGDECWATFKSGCSQGSQCAAPSAPELEGPPLVIVPPTLTHE